MKLIYVPPLYVTKKSKMAFHVNSIYNALKPQLGRLDKGFYDRHRFRNWVRDVLT